MIPPAAWRAVRWWLALILVSFSALAAMVLLIGQGLPRSAQFALGALWAFTFTVGMTGWIVQFIRLARRLRAAGGLLCPDCGGDLRSPPEPPSPGSNAQTGPEGECPHCHRALTPEQVRKQWKRLFHY